MHQDALAPELTRVEVELKQAKSNAIGVVHLRSQVRRRNLSIGRPSDCPRMRISDQRSPTSATRPAIVRSVKLRGVTAPRSTSSHVHGADTGADGFARTA